MKNIPQKIYLQIGDDDLSEVADDFKELSEVSWCHDKIYEHDIEYVLASQTAALQNRVKELEGELERHMELLESVVREKEYIKYKELDIRLRPVDLQNLWEQFKKEHNL